MFAVAFFPYLERTGRISSSGTILQIVVRFFHVSVFGMSSRIIPSTNFLVSSVVILGTIFVCFEEYIHAQERIYCGIHAGKVDVTNFDWLFSYSIFCASTIVCLHHLVQVPHLGTQGFWQRMKQFPSSHEMPFLLMLENATRLTSLFSPYRSYRSRHFVYNSYVDIVS